MAFDLGAMKEGNILAETPGLLGRVLAYDSLPLEIRQMYLGLLNYYCNASKPLLTPTESQFAFEVGGGEGPENFDYTKKHVMYPLQVLAEKRSTSQGHGVGASSFDLRRTLPGSRSLIEASKAVADAIINKLGKSLTAMVDRASVERGLLLAGI